MVHTTGARQVDAEHVRPVLDRHVDERANPGDTGVVDQQRRRPQRVDGVLQNLVGQRVVAHITDDGLAEHVARQDCISGALEVVR